MANLNLAFIGALHIHCEDSNDIVLANRKAIALLAYLAVEPRQVHSREILSSLLWPDLPKKDARNNLRVVWSHLMAHLPQASAAEPILVGNRLDLQLNPHSNIWVDVVEFEDQLRWCAAHASQHDKRSACPECHERLLRAATLYRGEFLLGLALDNCEAFEEWQFVQRERLHLQAIDVLSDIASFYEQTRQHSLAERFARRQLELDPLREQAHRQVMRMLACQGQRSAALAQFETCKHLLIDALGLEPDVETAALYQRIKTGDWPTPTIPLATAEAKTTPRNKLHVPQPTTPFIGREDELNGVAARLREGAYRLVSIVGAGGMGKTRLAVQLARAMSDHFADGVCFVPLTGLQYAGEIPEALWRALNAMNGDTPATTLNAETSLWQQTLAVLQDLKALIVLDNFEHLLHAKEVDEAQSAVDYVLHLLQHAPQVQLIITTREQLDVQAEDAFQLSGLPFPEVPASTSATGPTDPAAAGRYAAVRLFCERAYRANKLFKLAPHNVDAVVHICRRIQGNPLGIELAATWLNSMTCDELASALSRNFDILETKMRDMPPHHRSMRAVINQSWQMLAPAERTLLCRLSIFRDGFTLDAATTIADATPITLTRLRRTSLLQMNAAGRYDLHELLRQFALEQLGQLNSAHEPFTATFGEDELRQRHSSYYLRMVASYKAELNGQRPRAAQNSIRLELDNVREAWRWAMTRQNLAEVAQAMLGCLECLQRFYTLSGLYAEAEQVFAQALQHTNPTTVGLPLQLHLSLALAGILLRQNQLSKANQHAYTAQRLAQTLGDDRSEARAQLLLGWVLMEKGRLQAARESLEHAQRLAQQACDLALESEVLRFLGSVLNGLCMHTQGEIVLQQAHHIERALGNAVQEQNVLLYLGVCQLELGDFVQARTYLGAALRLVPQTGARSVEAKIENATGFLEARLNNFDIAHAHHDRSRQIAHEIGEPVQESHALHNLCTVNRKMGRLIEAEHFGHESLRIAVECASSDGETYAWLHLGYVWLAQHEWALAHQAFTHIDALLAQVERTSMFAEMTAGLAAVAFGRGDLDEALAHVHTAMAYTTQHGFAGTDEPQEMQRIYQCVLSAASGLPMSH